MFVDWVRYLREVKLYGNDDPLLPRTCVLRNEEGCFRSQRHRARGLGEHPADQVASLPKRSSAIGLPYFRPHSFRDTLVQFGERYAPSIEHFKAWSQNLGHEHITTTLTAYGNIDPYRQGELVRSMAGVADKDPNEETIQEVFDDFMRKVKGVGNGTLRR